MNEQLRLEGTEVPSEPLRLDAATCWVGLRGVARCREILTEVRSDETPTLR